MADTIDQQFVEYIAKTLVENEDAVHVDRTIDERGVLLQLHVAPEDLGRVIGRAGSTAKSIRTLLRALSVKNDARYNLKIVDSGDPAAAAGPAPQTDNVDPTPPAGPVATDDEMDVPDHSEESDAEEDTLSRSRREIADLTEDLDV